MGTILEFCALCELASKLLFSVSNRTAAFRKLVQWVAAALLLLAAGLAAALGQAGIHRFLRAFQSLEFPASLLSIGLLFALLLFTSRLGVSWKGHCFRFWASLGISRSQFAAKASLLNQWFRDHCEFTLLNNGTNYLSRESYKPGCTPRNVRTESDPVNFWPLSATFRNCPCHRSSGIVRSIAWAFCHYSYFPGTSFFRGSP